MSTNSARKFDFQNNSKFGVSEASSYLKITPSTLRRLENDGKIKSERLPNGYRQYSFGDLVNLRESLERQKETKKANINRQPIKQEPAVKVAPKSLPATLPVFQPYELRQQQDFSVPQIIVLKKLAYLGLSLCVVLSLAGGYRFVYQAKQSAQDVLSYRLASNLGDVLGDEARFENYNFNVNLKSVFNKPAEFKDTLTTNTATIGSLLGLKTVDIASEASLEKYLDVTGDVNSPTAGGLSNLVVSKIKGIPFGVIKPTSGFVLMGDGKQWQSMSTEEIVALGTISTGIWEADPIQPGYGGTGLSSYAVGDLIYASASGTLAPVNIGTANQVLVSSAGIPTWLDITAISGVTGTGIAGYMTYWDTTTNLADTTGMYWDVTNSRLGVGTTLPTSTLSVGAASEFQVNSTGNMVKVNNVAYSWPANQATSDRQVLTNDGSGNLLWGSLLAVDVDNDTLDFSELKDAMTLDASTDVAMDGYNYTFSGIGNVGIGTTNPQAALEIGGSGNLRIGGLTALRGVYTDANKQLTSTPPTSGVLGYWQRNGSYVAPATIGDYVGIGTTNPTRKFEIYNPGEFYTKLDDGVGYFETRMPANGWSMFYQNGVNAYTLTGSEVMLNQQLRLNGNWISNDGHAEGIRIDNSGNVGIGVADPGTAGLAVMSGNVGIGTTGPGAKLEVASGQIFAPNGSTSAPAYSFGSDSDSGISGGSGVIGFTTNGLTAGYFDSGQQLTVTNSISAGDGSVNVAGFAFRLDANTGLYRPGTDTLGFVTGGTEKMRVGANGGLSIGNSYVTTDPGAGNMIISGNIGIGTTNPQSALEIGGSGNLRVGGLTASMGVYTDANKQLTSTIPTSGSLGFWQRNGTNLAPATIGDNVGIGTTGPGAKLQVAGTGPQLKLQDTAGATGENARLELLGSNGTTYGVFGFMSSTTGNELTIQNAWQNGIGFYEGGVKYMRITPTGGLSLGNAYTAADPGTGSMIISGNVGIGTTAPGAKLEVVGTIKARNSSYDVDNVLIYGSSNDGVIDIFQDGAVTIKFRGEGDSYVNSGGNVGIGKVTPLAKLDVNGDIRNSVVGGNGNGFLGYSASGTHIFSLTRQQTGAATDLSISAYGGIGLTGGKTAGTETGNYHLYVKNNGNVGIGTTNPTSMLSVGVSSQFQVNSTGNIVKLNNVTYSWPASQATVAGSVLVNDASAGGNLTWASPSGTGTVGYWQRNGTSVAPANIGDNVGIGTTAPAGLLDVNGKLTVLANGNVGIGTTNPSVPLEIVSGATTTGASLFTADSLTAGTGLTYSFDALTLGTGISVGSTSTALSTGSLMNLDWSPSGSTEIYATGDLFKINVGTYGNVGNIFALYDDNTELFSVDQAKITNALPTEFTSAGDVSMAYDLVMSNQTASNIKSYGPITIEAGENWESNNLVLKTYNQGTVLVDYSDSGTTAADHTALQSTPIISGAITAGTRNIYGFYNNPQSLAANSGGTTNLYGNYLLPSATLATAGTTNVYGSYVSGTATHASDAGTVNQYGLYVANGTSSTNGTSAKYGLYIESPTGADTNYAAIFAGGNVGIGTTAPASALEIGGSGNLRIGGLTASQGVYTDANKQLTSTPPTTGILGYWQRNGTNLAPATIGDNVGIGTTGPATKLDVNGTVTVADEYGINFKDQNNSLKISGTYGQLVLNLNDDTTSGDQFIIGRYLGTARDYDHANPANPTLFIHSALDPNTDNTRWLSLSHTGTAGSAGYGLIDTGSGNLVLQSTAGNVGIGTTNPQSALEIGASGNLRIGGLTASMGVYTDTNKQLTSTAPTTGTLGYWQRNSTYVSPATITDYVGIGTTAPNAKLDIQGSSTTYLSALKLRNNAADTEGMAVGIDFEDVNSDTVTGSLRNYYEPNGYGLDFKVWNTTDALKQAMRIDKSGNVGIGTTGPGYKLSFGANTTPNTLALYENAGTDFYGFGINTTGTARLAISTANVERMAITNTGNVGIGTTSPSALLQVGIGGDASIKYTLLDGLRISGDDSGVNGNTIYAGSNNIGITAESGYKIVLSKVNSWATGLVVDTTSGNVGIGTTAPGALLSVNQSSGSATQLLLSNNAGTTGNYQQIKFQFSQANSSYGSAIRSIVQLGAADGGTLAFLTDNTGGTLTERMRIDNAGNVGIGTTAPSKLLTLYESTYTGNASLALSHGGVAHGVTGELPTDSYGLLWGFGGNGGGLQVTGASDAASQSPLKLLGLGGAGLSDAIPAIILEGAQGNGTARAAQESSDTTLVIRNYTTDLLTVKATGSVGIGTTNPGSAKLNVNGDVYLSSANPTLAAPANNAGFTIAQSNANGYINLQASGYLNVQTYESSWKDRLRITNAGNVGIGTTGPGARLDVKSSGTNSVATQITSSDGQAMFQVFEGSGTNGALLLYDGSVNETVRFNSEGTSWINGGNVGIGTTSPGYKLDISAGTTNGLRITTSNDSSYQLVMNNATFGTTEAKGFGLDQNNSGYARLFNNGITDISLSPTGNVGIGIANPGTAGLAIMNGNVGIGTTAPAAKLDVLGTSNQMRLSYSSSYYTNMSVDSTGMLTIAPNGTTAATLSDVANTFTLPTTFSSPGDVSMAYDLLFTNPSASYIKSDAPLYVESGNVYSNLDLTLRTFGTGDVVLDAPGGVTLAQAQNWSLVSGGSATALNIENGLMNFDTTNSRVGIGTTSPHAKFEVQSADTGSIASGSLTVANLGVVSTTAQGADKGSVLGLGGTYETSGSQAIFGAIKGAKKTGTTGEYDGYLSFYTLNDTEAALTERMRIDYTGNVGIGTTGPGTALDVVGIIRSSQAAQLGEIDFGTDGYNAIYRFNGITRGTAGAYTRIDSYADITFGTSMSGGSQQTEQMRITSTGNVGIGTTAPGKALDVVGGVRLSDALYSTSAMYLRPTGGQVFLYDNVTAYDFGLWNGATRTIKLHSTGDSYINAGNVGIGSTSPGYVLDVQHASSKINSKNGYLTNGADYAEYFYTKDGNLEAGEVVCVDLTTKNAVKRCANSGDANVMGIVSTNPAFLGNSSKDKENNPNYAQIAMLGQIPVKVTNEGGEIAIGDELTSATLLGFARKAAAGEPTVGVALENFTGETGTIQIMISRKNKSLTVEKVEDQITDRIAQMNIKDQVDALVASAVDTYNLQNNLQLLTIDASGNVVLGSDPSHVVVSNTSITTNQDFIAKLGDLETLQASDSAKIVSMQSDVDDVKAQLEELIASMTDVADESTESSQSSSSATLAVNQTPSDLLVVMQTIYEDLKAMVEALGLTKDDKGLAVNSNLTVLGDTALRNVKITGDIMAGMLKIDTLNNQIDLLGPACYTASTGEMNTELCQSQTIFVQKNLAGNVDMFNGAIVFEPDGTLKAMTITTQVMGVDSKGQSIGEAVVKAGETNITIASPAAKGSYKVFVTSTSNTDGDQIFVKEKAEGEFVVALTAISGSDVKFDWWIVRVD